MRKSKTQATAKRAILNFNMEHKVGEPRDFTISKIIKLTENICEFWSNAHGWAPSDAAELLGKSRLDRQVSLSHCLRLWLDTPTDNDAEGRLTLAWANLGSLVEGTMKFFLSVYEADYSQSPVTRGERHKPCDIDKLKFEELKQFFMKNIWTDSQKKWDAWLTKIQGRRNAIHAYKNQDIGTFDDFFEELGRYLDFANEIESQVPYP